MCGIAGKYNFQMGEPVSAELIRAMCDVMAYRGPDDEGVYTQGPLGLGHRRLSIIDLSPLGHQPMASSDKEIWIVFNGEIYNFLVLREMLLERGHHFKSNTDTEVIINLYRQFGVECLEHLRGMFAFALWDRKKSCLFIARDRIGKKPLFYYTNGRTLTFGSEIKCILQDPIVSKKINYEAFCDYFKYQYVPDPKTIYKNIHKLEPGHYLLCSRYGIRKQQYWDVSFAQPSNHCLTDLSGELLELLEESVRLRMISDVPLGAFLSGGIDSSGVVALMARQQEGPVTTCSIGFNSEIYDEIRFARIVAANFGTDHHEFTVQANAEAILDDLAFYFDEPFADSSAVPTHYVSKLARQRVTVALSGDGGDENFAGYEKYHLDAIENRLRGIIPGFIRKSLFSKLSTIMGAFTDSTLQRGKTLLNTLSHEADFGFYLTNTDFDDGLWDALLKRETRKEIGDYDASSVTRDYYHRADTDDHLSKILYTDLKTYLPGDILVKVDRMSMANSLEVRAPILDHNIIEFAASVPSVLKFRNGEKKYILKQAYSKILPDDILKRRKMGFSVPLAEWLRGELKDFAHRHLFRNKSGLSNYFHLHPLVKVWETHQLGKRNYASTLWTLLMFELWHKNFMD